MNMRFSYIVHFSVIEVQITTVSICLCQIAKALSVRVLSEIHEKQRHPPETHKEVWLVPPASQ